MDNQLFRKQSMDRISSPEQLQDYMRVTSPGIWMVLSAVIVLLAGLIICSMVGKIETTYEVNAEVQDGKVSVILSVPLTGEVWVTLQDAAGHEVMSTHIPTGQSSVTLSLDHLPSGSYYATLHYPDGTATEKIVLK